MKAVSKSILLTSLMLAATAGVTACSDDHSAEDVGEKIDQTMTDTGNAIEDTCEDVKESAGAEDTDC
jgi:predicted small secreted protein